MRGSFRNEASRNTCSRNESKTESKVTSINEGVLEYGLQEIYLRLFHFSMLTHVAEYFVLIGRAVSNLGVNFKENVILIKMCLEWFYFLFENMFSLGK